MNYKEEINMLSAQHRIQQLEAENTLLIADNADLLNGLLMEYPGMDTSDHPGESFIEELEEYKKALELACDHIRRYSPELSYMDYWRRKARETMTDR